MKKAHKKLACNYKNLQGLGEALCGSLPKMLPKPKSSVDQVTAFCWDAVMQTINFTATFRPPERLSGKSADRSLIQISLWLEGETHSILLSAGGIIMFFKCWTLLFWGCFFLNRACRGWIIGRPAALDWLALRSDQRAPLPKLRSADTSVPSRPAPGPLSAPAMTRSKEQKFN